MTRIRPYIWLALGSALLLGMGWRWNVPLAVWLAPVFLMRFFRAPARGPATLLALPAMTLPLFLNVHGGWDFPIAAEIGIGVVRAAPFLLALYADRFTLRRLPAGLATLVYPAVYVVADYLLALTPLGTVFSASVTQFHSPAFIQLAALTGVWGLSFVMGWFASVVNLAWQHDFSLRQSAAPVVVFCVALAAILLAGGWRLSHAPAAPTVRVAGVTIEHPRDYWAEVVDIDTPADTARRYETEVRQMETDLFVASRRAVDAGARIVFWSEGNGVIYPEDLDAFLQRAARFADEHDIYFAPAYIVFRYGEATTDNLVTMITPAGEIAYTYEKTKSWYPSNSDGVLHVIDTPYGRLSTAICFDMDFPGFIRQAGQSKVDIMLAPAFDWEPIKPYHSQVGLFRGPENGFSIVRQVNAGTSMAIDYQGRLLAYQDFYYTGERTMLADVPTRGVRTLYAACGDWLVYACGLFAAGALVASLIRRRPARA